MNATQIDLLTTTWRLLFPGVSKTLVLTLTLKQHSLKKKKEGPRLRPRPLPRVLLTPAFFFSLQTYFMLNLVNSKMVNFKQIGNVC